MSDEPPDLQSVAADVQVLKTQVSNIATSVESLIARQGSFERAVTESRQVKWPLVLSFLATAAGVFAFISNDGKKNTENEALKLEIKLLKTWAPVAAKAEMSERDRSDIHSNLARNVDAIAENKSAIAGLVKDFGEVETQFKAADEFRNMNQSHVMRYIAILWQKVNGEALPSDGYYPSISKQR